MEKNIENIIHKIYYDIHSKIKFYYNIGTINFINNFINFIVKSNQIIKIVPILYIAIILFQ